MNIRLAARGVRSNHLGFEGLEKNVITAETVEGERQAWFSSKNKSNLTPTMPRGIVEQRNVDGPAILEAYDTTIVLPPGASARTDHCGSIVIDVPENATE